MQDVRGWMLVVFLFMGVFFAHGLLQRVSAFKVIDHAMCKHVDVKTGECEQRTSEFQPSDEEAYFWFKGTIETSDIGAKAEFKAYDPDGNLFVSPVPVAAEGAGDVVGWINIGVAKDGGIGFLGGWMFTAGPQWVKRASEKLGEWRAEFTLDDKVVVSERFRILGITTTATANPTTVTTPPRTVVTPVTVVTSTATVTETPFGGIRLPTNILLITAVLVIVALVAGYMYTRTKKPTSSEITNNTSHLRPISSEE